MSRHLASVLKVSAALFTLALAVPLVADDRPAQPRPEPRPLSFQEQVSQANSEALSRMLIDHKRQRAAIATRNAAAPELAQLDEEMSQITSNLRGRLNQEEPTTEGSDALPSMAYFPRIVPPAPVSAVPPAPSVTTPAPQNGGALASASPSPFSSLETPEDLATRNRLEQPILLVVQDQPLGKVLEFIESQCKVPLRVKWKALESVGIDRNTPVTANLPNLPARRVLARILVDTSETANMSFAIEDSGATVSTRDDLNSVRYQTVRIYDVRDLATPTSMPYLPAEVLWNLRQVQVTGLTDTIKAVVAPDTWRDNGGTIGSIREFDGLLIINQTKDNQFEVEQLLNHLRTRR